VSGVRGGGWGPETAERPRLRMRGGLAPRVPAPVRPAAEPAAEPRDPGWGIAAVEWTPVYVFFLVYIFSVITFRLPLGNVGMVLALLALPFQRERLRFPPLLMGMTAFLLWAFATSGGSQYGSIVGERLTDYGKLWLIALVAVNALRTRRQTQFLLLFALVCFALFPARGAIFNYLGGHTVFGRAVWNHIYANPNDLAALALLQLAGAGALLVSDRRGWVRAGALTSVLVLSFLVLMTQSRGGLIALVLLAALALGAQRRRLRTLLFVLAAAGGLSLFAPAGVWERAAGLVHATDTSTLRQVDEEGSAEQRFLIWKVAAAIVADHPVSGVGLGAYPPAHEAYARDGGFPRHAGGKRDTHSTYLNVAAETGGVGLLIFLGMLGAVLVGAERARRRLRETDPAGAGRLWLLQAGLLAYLTAGVFGSFAHLSHLYLFLALVTAASLEARPRPPGPSRRRATPRGA
jgi:O-antigen ligase